MEQAETLEPQLRQLLDLVGGEIAGGGSAAAIAGALASAVVAAAARGAGAATWPEAPAAVAQANAFRHRLETLARRDAEVYRRATDVLREHRGDAAIVVAVGAAADVPVEIAEASADVAELAAEVASRCDTHRANDAAVAVHLAAAAARAATDLVRVNLTTAADDPRLLRAAAAADAAAALSRTGSAP